MVGHCPGSRGGMGGRPSPCAPAGQGRFEAATASPARPSSTLRVNVRARGRSYRRGLPSLNRCASSAGPASPRLGDCRRRGALECYSAERGIAGRWRSHRHRPAAASRSTWEGWLLPPRSAVNGQVAGIRVASPWRVDISGKVKAGENRIEVWSSTPWPTTTSPFRPATGENSRQGCLAR